MLKLETIQKKLLKMGCGQQLGDATARAADVIGCTPMYIYMIATGRRNPQNINILKKLNDYVKGAK